MERAVKDRIIAAYWGAKVFRYDYDTGKILRSVVSMEVMDYSMGEKCLVGRALLELKDISQVTENELIEIAQIIKRKTRTTTVRATEIAKYYITTTGWDKMSIAVVDYLRSKGYATPFGDYSIEDLVACGVYKMV